MPAYFRREEEGMTEHRRSKRVKVKLKLEVSSVFKQDNIKVSNINAPIEVVDISRSGLAFITESILPIGYYFNSRLEFENKEDCLSCVVRIVRRSERDDGTTLYGCEFVGMASVFDYIFDDIEKLYG